jgi:hypothetical protein
VDRDIVVRARNRVFPTGLPTVLLYHNPTEDEVTAVSSIGDISKNLGLMTTLTKPEIISFYFT